MVDVHLRRPFDFDQDSTISGSSTAENCSFTLDMNTQTPRLNMRSSVGSADAWITHADGSAYDITAPGNWELSQYYDSWNTQKGEEWAWRADATLDLELGPLRSVDVVRAHAGGRRPITPGIPERATI
nr:hypothetical protein [Xanthomonas axonopodis]